MSVNLYDPVPPEGGRLGDKLDRQARDLADLKAALGEAVAEARLWRERADRAEAENEDLKKWASEVIVGDAFLDWKRRRAQGKAELQAGKLLAFGTEGMGG